MTTITVRSNLKATSTRGFSLVELMIVTGILSLIIGLTVTFVSFVGKQSKSLSNYSEMHSLSRNGLEMLARDIRMGYDVNAANAVTLNVSIYGKADKNEKIIYTFNPGQGDLVRLNTSTTPVQKTTVLEDLESFTFRYYDMAGQVTSDSKAVKEIQVEGVMKRSFLSIDNTNHFVSARTMMRGRAVPAPTAQP